MCKASHRLAPFFVMKRILTLILFFVALAAQAQRDTIRVLSIGNSYARDAFTYVPMLIEELAKDTYVEFGILYIPGCTLQRHWECASSKKDKADYEFDYYTTGTKRWTTTKQTTIQKGVKHTAWDLVIMQQQSRASQDYKTYMPYLSSLVDFVRGLNAKAAFAWHFTPSYPDGSKRMSKGLTSEKMWQRISIAAQQVMLHDEFRLVIPSGTAIQYARRTDLDRFGAFGHMSNDGLHMQDGIPRLTEAYTATQSLLNYFGKQASVADSHLLITNEFLSAIGIPQRQGTLQAIRAHHYLLAKASAVYAVENPFKM